MSLDYSDFAPRLYNFCHSAGLARRKLSLGAAFCTDQEHGRATLLLAKHFGVFPIELGNAGGVLDFRDARNWIARSNDIVLLQADHVLNASAVPLVTGSYGPHAKSTERLTGCGALLSVLDWYQREYQYALSHVQFRQARARRLVEIDTVLLETNRKDGLCLNLDRLAEKSPNGAFQTDFGSDSKVIFHANTALPDSLFEGQDIQACNSLFPEWFSFNTSNPKTEKTLKCAEANLRDQMPYIVSAQDPLLAAAEINIQKEFGANTQRIRDSGVAKGKRLVYLTGINVETPNRSGKGFSEAAFIPWQAFIQDDEGKCEVLNQAALFHRLREASPVNADAINLDMALRQVGPHE